MGKVKGIDKNGKVVEINGDEFEKLLEEKEKEKEADKPKVKNEQQPPKRYRRFKLITYIDRPALDDFVMSQPWIQHWAMCTHDRDVNDDGTPKEKHTHLLLYTYDGKTSSGVKKIFDRFSKAHYQGSDIEPQNTLIQVMTDPWHEWRYLIHKDNPERFQYDEFERTADDFGYWKKYESTHGYNDSVENSATQMLNDLCNGATTRFMVEHYGKDFMYHIRQIREVYALVNMEESAEALAEKPLDMLEWFPILLQGGQYSSEQITMFMEMIHWIRVNCLMTFNSKLDVYMRKDDDFIKQLEKQRR